MLGIMKADVTICTATIPTRTELLKRAISSVENQTLQPQKHLIKLDDKRDGHTAMLDAMIAEASTKYIAILDDDDELLPRHIEAIYGAIEETGADLVYPWFKYSNLPDGGHLEMFAYKPWSNSNVHQIPITWIAKREALLEVGGFSKDFNPDSYEVDNQGNRIGHDFVMIQKLVAADKKIVHHPELTWIYHVGHPSTLGMPIRW
jgi:glycosyltransferase involved in cell wall biosynthesis